MTTPDDTTITSPSGMVTVHVTPSGGDRELMALEAQTVIASLAMAFAPEAAAFVVGTIHPPADDETIGEFEAVAIHHDPADAIGALRGFRGRWPESEWRVYALTDITPEEKS